MTKAEEAAMKAYPNDSFVSVEYADMCRSFFQEGYELAEKDLELRGPGDFYGTRQHGIPTLRAANLYTDMKIASEATEAVNRIIEEGGEEAERLNDAIKKMFELRFARKMEQI